MPPVWKIAEGQFAAFEARLAAPGFSFENRPGQVFLARKPGVSVNLYANGTVLLGGSDGAAMRGVEAMLQEFGGTRTAKSRPAPDAIEEATGARIGTDESGKGDYFGPLVVAGVLVTPETEARLKALGVRDSKTISDKRIVTMAAQIREVVGLDCFEELTLTAAEYNRMYEPVQGVGALLGWAHAQLIENLLEKGPPCGLAVADQFGDERHIKRALMGEGRKVRLLQTPKGERDTAVAAASVLARDRFVRALGEMGKELTVDFPKGSSHVVDFGVEFVRARGDDALQRVAKLHFATTAAILRAARRKPVAHRPG